MIDTPGLYTLPLADYLADPCATPSLSASIARLLVSASPLHAWTAHPRLNPAYEPENAETFDVGTACHAYLLEGKENFVLIDAPDYRKTDARAARDAARAEGKTPLLADRWADVRAMVKAAQRQLEAFEDVPQPLAAGTPEQTLIWREGKTWCRARPDWLHEDGRTVDDYKTTEGTAQPEAWSRFAFDRGYDIQAAWYLRGLKAVTGREWHFRLVVQERTRPYALSVLALAPDALALAERKVARALDLWRYCVDTNRWPGYPQQVCHIEAPPWELAKWEMKEAQDDGRPLADQLFGRGKDA